ncbi:hypothetical protein [Methylomonas paludis]|nr:hypothetical protein [Methylomonas paludis]
MIFTKNRPGQIGGPVSKPQQQSVKQQSDQQQQAVTIPDYD